MGHLVLPGVGGNFVSAPDIAAYDLVDTFFLAAYVAFDDWTPGATQALVTDWTAAGNQRAYMMSLSGIGRLQMAASNNGAANESVGATVSTGFADGTAHWVGANFNGGLCQFWDGGTDVTSPAWVQIGTDVSLATIVACHDSTGLFIFGAINGGGTQVFAGQVHRAIAYSDLARTTRVFDADFTDLTAAEVAAGSFIEDSPNAAVVTINGALWSYVSDARRVMPSPRYGLTRMARR